VPGWVTAFGIQEMKRASVQTAETGVSREERAFPYPCEEFTMPMFDTNMYIKQGLPSWIGEY